MTVSSPSIQTIEPASRAEHNSLHVMLRVATIGALLVALLGGKFSFSRFASETAAVHWLELRCWFTLAVIAGLAFERTFFNVRIGIAQNPQTRWLLSAVVVLNSALFIHLWIFGAPNAVAPFGIDLAYVTVHAFLFAVVIRSSRDVLIFVYLAEAIGLILMALAVAGFGNPDLYGTGWAPFGTPITFYRIELLVFCGALYAAYVARTAWLRTLHMAISSVALFGVISSLSKAALLAATMVAIYLVMALLVCSRPRRAMEVGILFVATVIAATAYWHSPLGQRLEHLQPMTHQAPAIERQMVVLASYVSPQPSTIGSSTDATGAIASAPNHFAHDPAELNKRNLVVINDQTQRIRLFVIAWNQFWSSKLYGVGFGRYEARVPSSDRRSFDIYRYPHNVLLELLAASGLFGAGLFSIAVLAGIVVLHQAIGRDDNWIFISAYPLGVLTSSLFMGDLYDLRAFFLITILVASAADWRSHPRDVLAAEPQSSPPLPSTR